MSGGISRFPEGFQDFRRDSQIFGEMSGVPWRFQGFIAISTPLQGFLTFQVRFDKHFQGGIALALARGSTWRETRCLLGCYRHCSAQGAEAPTVCAPVRHPS